jgi:hypothetical protein
MRPLGFHGFAVVARDRGDRVVHRTALDHPDVMERIALGAKFWAWMRRFAANGVLIILRAPAYHPSWIQQWEEVATPW